MKLPYTKILLLICLLSVFGFIAPKKAHANAPNVEGYVLSAKTNAPVAGVWVKWTPTTPDGIYRYAQTDSTGLFYFPSIGDLSSDQIQTLEDTYVDATNDGQNDTEELYAAGDLITSIQQNFSCGDNPQTFTATSRTGGTYSTISGITVNNGNDTIKVGTIIYTPPAPTPTPTPATYSISGNVFVDANKNGLIDNGENNYTGSPAINSSHGTVATNSNGSYTISGITPGTNTVSYTSTPTGYTMTSPVNGPPPSRAITVGNACTTNGAVGAACATGNITNLNFGITNLHPWWQSTCGDVRENPIADLLPAGASALVGTANCSNTPGVIYTGNTNANFGQGQDSSTNQIVGGASYPEVYSSKSNVLATSYSSLLAKAQNANITPTSLSTVCNLTNCTLPANLAHGIYLANGDTTLNAFTFPPNQNYVILVKGNVTIKGAISVPVGSTALFAPSGNITVASTVGAAAAVTTPTLSGWYVAGQSFVLPTQGNCADLRLNIAGSVVVNAQGGGGTLQNSRDLCGNDQTDPTISFTQRLDMILNAPQFLEQQQTLSQEVAP